MRLAARGTRNLDHGDEPIADPSLVTRLRGRARRLHVRAALAAVVLTALSLVAPGW